MEADQERQTLLRIQKWEKQILGNPSQHQNFISELLKTCGNWENSSTILYNAVKSLQQVFSQLHQKGAFAYLQANNKRSPKKTKTEHKDQAKDKPTADESTNENGGWLLSCQRSYMRLLAKLFHHHHHQLQILALKVYMSFMQQEAQEKNKLLGSSVFPNTFFFRLIEHLVTSGCGGDSELLRLFDSKYLVLFADIRYYTLHNLTKLFIRKREAMVSPQETLSKDEKSSNGLQRKANNGKRIESNKNQKEKEKVEKENEEEEEEEEEDDDAEEIWNIADMPMELFVRNAHVILQKVKMPTKQSEIKSFFITPQSQLDKAKEQARNKASAKNKKGKSSNNADKVGAKRKRKEAEQQKQKKSAAAPLYLLGHRKAFEDCWLAFLRLPLPGAVYKSVLRNMHDQVIPYFNTPVRLMDFLKDSYDKGGIISLLALHGVFILITQHNLDYPDFYRKLYALYEPSVFYVKHRAEFFKLSALFLSSSHLPAYLVAAFIKRMARLALAAPPSGALLMIAFMYNLLYRHPQCRLLLHRDAAGSEDTKSRPSALMLAAPESNGNTEQTQQSDQATQNSSDARENILQILHGDNPGSDPFLFQEPDPKKCQALSSSLWEIKALATHYDPQVKLLLKAFEGKLTKQPFDLESFVELSYSSLFETHIKRKMPASGTPLAFQPQDSLFVPSDCFASTWRI